MYTPFSTVISSFNMRGGGIRKKNCLAGLLSPDRNNILLLQDAGTNGADPYGHTPGTAGTGLREKNIYHIGTAEFLCALTVSDPVSRSPNSTVSILIETDLLPGVSKWGYEAVSGISHYTCWVDLSSGIRIATLHAASDPAQAVAEVKSSLLFLDGTSEEWLLMGSFHSSPGEYLHERPAGGQAKDCDTVIRYGGGRDRGFYCNLLCRLELLANEPGKDSNTDFAFYSRKHTFKLQGLEKRMVSERSGRLASNHPLTQIYLKF